MAALVMPAWAASLDPARIEMLGPIPLGETKAGPHQDAIVRNIQTALAELDSDKLTVFGQSYSWRPLEPVQADAAGLILSRMELGVDGFTTGHLSVTGLDKVQLFVDGQKQEKEDKGFKLALPTGDYQLLVVAEEVVAGQSPGFEFTGAEASDQVTLQQGKRRLSARQLFDSPVVSNLQVSPKGAYALVSYRRFTPEQEDTAVSRTELVRVKDMQVQQVWDSAPANALFSPDEQHLLFSQHDKLQAMNLKDLSVRVISGELKDASGFRFVNSDSLVFAWNQEGKDDGELVKRYQALEDRWSGWRDNSQLYQLDLDSGFIRQLTDDKASSSLLDVNEDKGTLLIGRSLVDYSSPPHGLSGLYELDLASLTEREIGQYRALNDARYAKSGLYVLGGPNFAGGAGLNVSEGLTANDYDGQLYHMALDGSNVKALSKSYDPAISAMQVLDNDDLLLKVGKADRVPLVWYDASEQKYKELTPQLDVVKHWAASEGDQPQILYAGTTTSIPQALYRQKLGRKAEKVWDSANYYADTRIPELEEFDFVNARGQNIDGRVYLPHNLDKNRKYPAIIYYYGGTAPVTRGFTGRYPFNLWAAHGYVVYVLQPTGTTGYGQDMSARHVNAWGDDTTEDVIAGTQAFLKAHPYVDADKLGHIGASYGGFMTMWLATQTDIFAASISHAGISNITSYWGQGWWGFGYSGVASRGSFPWNNADLYSQHSPLFHADKISNPMLLIHGDADTNVPPGESQNMYTALKLLGKDVELVEYKGDNHHILTRDKTFHWWSTILAYFDKHLKDEPQWWQHLYPQE
ncbi:S9 family peptidase [Bowmanella dokdonensis]|uniref:S9 family peptidase n=2 Tax=Bowmanella dokdonensis TaxID=751969 RepID=A0A939DM80_9ALTE|nr:S9 family peptidase [Bowmanella dokdonensis]